MRIISTTMVLVSLMLTACGSEPVAENGIAVVNGTEQTSRPTGPAPEETRGQEFVSRVLGSYDFVLAGSKLVTERAERPDAKAHAQKLLTDIGASRDALLKLAEAQRLKPEPTPGPTHQSDLSIFSSGRGAALESAFVTRSLEELMLLVGTMRAYKNGGDNEALKAWAATDQDVVNNRLLDTQTLSAVMEEDKEKAAAQR